MHTGPMPDSDGEFGGWKSSGGPCRHCGETAVLYRVWESSCGGFEDYHFKCKSCGQTWWVDGIDS